VNSDAGALLKIYRWMDCDATGMPWKYLLVSYFFGYLSNYN